MSERKTTQKKTLETKNTSKSSLPSSPTFFVRTSICGLFESSKFVWYSEKYSIQTLLPKNPIIK